MTGQPLPEPSKAEVELCSRWMDLHGDDPAKWPPEIHKAYENTLTLLLSEGQS